MTRFAGPESHALIAGDTFEPMVERITKMLSHDRRMTVIRQDAKPSILHPLANSKDKVTLDEARDRLSVHPLRIEPGLKPDPREDQPIEVTRHNWPEPTSQFWVRLYPGIGGFGFAAEDSSTEQSLRARWESRGLIYDSPVTQVRITGFGTEAGRHDRIEIEKWNEHRYGEVITITFQCDWDY